VLLRPILKASALWLTENLFWKGVCDLYQGEYDPHYLTGLCSLLWIIDTYYEDVDIVLNALFQYLSFFFRGSKSKG
jgi:hypothetical protein